MKTVGAFDAKTHLSRYLREVETTREKILIQRRGRNIAVIEAYEDIEAKQGEAQDAEIVAAFREIRETEATYGANAEIRELREDGRRK